MTKVELAVEALKNALREEILDEVEKRLGLGNTVGVARSASYTKAVKKTHPHVTAPTHLHTVRSADIDTVVAWVKEHPGQRGADIKRACGIHAKERWEVVRAHLERRGNTKSARYYPKAA